MSTDGNRSAFLPKLILDLVVVTGFVGSVVTIVLGYSNNSPLLTVVGALVILLTCLSFCYREHRIAQRAARDLAADAAGEKMLNFAWRR